MLHNSTYICMKLMGIFVIMYLLKNYNNFMEKITLKQWISLTLILTLTNLTKPNSIMFFSLVILTELLIDFIKTQGKKLNQLLIIGLSVLVSLLILLFQYKILFTGMNATKGLGIGIKLGYNLNFWSKHPIISIIQSLAFPLYVLIINYKDILKDKYYRLFNCAVFWGFLEYILLIETGKRMNYFNFIWGYAMSIFIFFISGVYKLYQNIHIKKYLYRKRLILLFILFHFYYYHCMYYLVSIM